VSPSLGALIPAFQAERTVGPVVSGALDQLPLVLVVDDGSDDRTGVAAESAGARVVRHPANRGKGAALITGFEWMLRHGVDAVVTLDADGQHDTADIGEFLSVWDREEPDLIVGSRRQEFERMSRGRRIGNRFSCNALRFFTGLELEDSQSGFRLYAAGFLKELRLRRRSYDAEMEVLLRAVRERRRIRTIPIRAHAADGNGTSHFRPWLDTYRICRTVVAFSVCEY